MGYGLMGKESERLYCSYIDDGVAWLWRTRPSRRDHAIEERDCVISCTGNDKCAKKQKATWAGRNLDGAKPKNDCPICKDFLSCEDLCY